MNIRQHRVFASCTAEKIMLDNDSAFFLTG